MSAASATIGTLSGNGRVEANNNQWQGMTTLTFGNAGSSSFYGYIQDGGSGNAGSLIYAGTGTFTLWGEDDLHGTTTINSGTFVNNGIIGVPGVGNAGVIVNSGATLTGSGQITGTLSVSGGIANMTGATIGTLSVTSYGTATLTGATINGAITINTEGSVSLTNSTVNGALTDGPPGGGAYYATFTGNGNTINGNVVVYDGATSAGSSFIGNNNTINGSLIVGHITAGRPAAVFSGNNNVINSPSYDVQINNGTISGSNTITTSHLDINSSNVAMATLSGSNVIYGPTGLSWNGSAGYVGSTNALVTGSNTFNGNVTIYGGTMVGSNTVNGNLTAVAGSNAVLSPHVTPRPRAR